jgi:hypothetical protein
VVALPDCRNLPKLVALAKRIDELNGGKLFDLELPLAKKK